MLGSRRGLTAVIVLLGIGTVVACGDAVTSPEDDNPYEQPMVADAPPLPVPASPTADVPVTSDTLAKIVVLATNYRPVVDSMHGDWIPLLARWCDLVFRSLQFVWECGYLTSPDPNVAEDLWSSSLPSVPLVQTVPLAFPVPLGRVVLVTDGQHMGPVEPAYVDTTQVGDTDMYIRYRRLRSQGLSDTVYVRRDRFWERKTLEGGAGDYLLLIGDTEGEISTTFTQGTSETETETFGKSVTVTVGADFGTLSASVSATLSQSYSTSVTISREETQTFTKIVRGRAGKTVRFMVWELVELYTFSDASGAPFTDPNFVVRPDTLFRRGVATALQATEF